MIGNGPTDAVCAEIDISLTSHELIKNRIRSGNKKKYHNLCFKIKQKLKTELAH